MSDDDFLEPIRRAARRRETGPICALCRHVSLDEGDLLPLDLPVSLAAVNNEIRSERCKRVGRFVTADSGHNCRYFDRGPRHG